MWMGVCASTRPFLFAISEPGVWNRDRELRAGFCKRQVSVPAALT